MQKVIIVDSNQQDSTELARILEEDIEGEFQVDIWPDARKKNIAKLSAADLLFMPACRSRIANEVLQKNEKVKIVIHTDEGHLQESILPCCSGCHGPVEKPYTAEEIQKALEETLHEAP